MSGETSHFCCLSDPSVVLYKGKSEVSQSYPTLCHPMDCNLPGFSVHGIHRQEYWSGFPFPSPGHLPNPGIEPRSTALQADALPSEPPGKRKKCELTNVDSCSKLLSNLLHSNS